ncbi:ribonuclease H-like YkuK family protein [Cytobacillus sp. S13-E01]|uniref:ribonuclease H-like YkuK family protein n=1 Tax=Cytobacillus sp. S13-E01 TaxID=3031326 RepID=UPI0023D7FB11|nr:ribonuclease H-like YkuK family protein [Cytobacillus sp. S13-E01]MDF0725376.1 ribonuclease H-like YkuK family protein [Cytobacillus sp. S13-E01]
MSETFTFYNVTEGNMDFETVINRLKDFIMKDPRARYRLSIGTDSQVHQDETRFITAIHLHRVGKGAWGCLKNYCILRPIKSVREKISLETSFSQEIAYMFTTEYLMELTDLILPYAEVGADLTLEIHLDIGKKGVTKDLISDMTGRINAMGLEAKIKPDSYAAFSYANRYTK